MTDVNLQKTDQKYIDRRTAREDNFYSQTVAENNARLDAKIPAGDVRDEIKFIESQLLAMGPQGD